MFEIKYFNHEYYYKWMEMALKDDKVWPFLSRGYEKNWNIDFNNDWNQVHFLSDSGLCLLSLFFERKEESVNWSMFTIEQNKVQKRRDTYEIIKNMFRNGYLFKRFGVKYLDTMVHETNPESISFVSKRMPPWGIKPFGAYDRKLGQWVSAYHYRLTEDDYKRVLPKIYFST